MGLLTTSDVPENTATAVAVDVVIVTLPGSVAAAIVAPTVRVWKLAACAATPVVVSAFVVMVQLVAAGSAAVATVNVMVAL
jgi:hypothetical protein